MDSNRLNCPVCSSTRLMVKYEAKYVYSYLLDENAPGLKNIKEFLPFMFDNREQTEARQYIECGSCGTQYPYFLSEGGNGLDFKILHNAFEPYGSEAEEIQ